MTTQTIGTREDRPADGALGAADLLCLATAPVFAVMARLTGILGGGPQDMVCAAVQDASPLNRMKYTC